MTKSTSQKHIILEELYRHHRYLIWAYIWAGYRVHFLRLHKACETKEWVHRYIQRGILHTVAVSLPDINFEGFAPDDAHSNIDRFCTFFQEHSGVSRAISALYTHKEIVLAFKSSFNQRLARFYYLNRMMSRFSEEFPQQRVFFIPSNGIEVYRTDGCEIYDYKKLYAIARLVGASYATTPQVLFPRWASVLSYVRAGVRRFKTVLKVTFFPLWLAHKRIGAHPVRCRKNTYAYASMIISPARQFANTIQKVDFLVDTVMIKKDEMLFLSYTRLHTDHRKYLDSHELDYIDELDAFMTFKNVQKSMRCYGEIALRAVRAEPDVIHTALQCLYYWVKWRGFLEKVRFPILITYGDFTVQSIARNIIMEEFSCRTFHYMDSANYGCFLRKKGQPPKYRFLIGFLYGDYFISWSDVVSEHFQASGCRFKQYINLGCLWAEHVRLINNGTIKSDLKRKMITAGYHDGMKVVAVFDSGFHNYSITTYADGIAFLRDIRALLDAVPSLFVILKEKKLRTYHAEITGAHATIQHLYADLANHPRCYCVTKWENSSEIIANADVTISFPFTSTTFEALAARKKAFWYDATGKFRDTFYDSIPGIVCHGYTELVERVEELAFNISREHYDRFLDEYVKGPVESHLDGNAISRFKTMVCKAAAR